MTTASATLTTRPKVEHTFGTANTAKVGMWIYLVTDAMTFAGLLLAYAILRAGNPHWPMRDLVSKFLGIPFTGVMTFVLIVSSLFMVLALDAAKRQRRKETVKWLLATAGGGAFFLGGQVYEYAHLIHKGFTLQAGALPASFFVVTSFHGAHVFTGVTYLLIIAFGVSRGRHLSNDATHVEIAGLFWHFVDLIWILVFTLVYLLY